jgi:hypothetical protein
MADQDVSLNPNDPIAQTLHAEVLARAAYNDAGYHRNFLEMKAKKGDLEAKQELPEAQRQVGIALDNLKRVQSYLALLTGAKDPNAKQKVASVPPKKDVKTTSTQIASNETVSPQPLKRAPLIRGEFIQRAAYFEITVEHSLFRKNLQKELEKILKDKSPADIRKMLINPPQNGEMIHILKTTRGETATRMQTPLLLASVTEYFKKSE